jgi:O-antigen/teichoic acid export membrane protein
VTGNSIGQQAVRGSFYSVASSGVTLLLGLVRSILVTRLLLPAEVGIFRQALVILLWVGQISNFGFDAALIHRDRDIEKAYSTHFILNLSLNGLVVIASLLLAPLLSKYYPNMHGLSAVFVTLALLEFVRAFNFTPLVLLTKELQFRKIATIDVISSVSMTIVAPLIAYLGFGYWALVAERVTGVIVRTGILWLYYRPWSPEIRFDKTTARWFFGFGSKIFTSRGLNSLLDQFDDFWIGTVLGKAPLGFYGKAYEFAGYPQRVVGNPILNVIFPTFAKVQHDRLRLSQAFFRAASLIVRAGFLFAGVLTLVIPEFIRIFLGDQWLPMAFTFQLMLIYTLLSPLYSLSNRLTTAIGKPGVRIWIQLIQIIIFIPGVILSGQWFGIEGVAVAADIMMLMGVVLFLLQARKYVDISLRILFGWPTIGLIMGIGAVLMLAALWSREPDWISLLGKSCLLTFVYGTIIFIAERKPLTESMRYLLKLAMIQPNDR